MRLFLLTFLIVALGSLSHMSSNVLSQATHQGEMNHLRRLEKNLQKEGEIVDRLDERLNQEDRRGEIELKLREITEAINNQQQVIARLEEEREWQEQQVFQRYAEQSLQTQAIKLDRDIALARVRDELDRKGKYLEALRQRVVQLTQSGIISDELTRSQRLYAERLEDFRRSQAQYQNLVLQQRQEDDLLRRREEWQGRADQELLQQEFQNRSHEEQERLQNLEKEYGRLQEQLADQQNELDILNQEYLEHRRRYDELETEYEKELARSSQPTLRDKPVS